MRKRACMKESKFHQTGADLFRHLIFAWLLAVTVGYLRLPVELRGLETMEGLEQMSFAGMLLITVAAAGLLSIASRYFCLRSAERWGMVGLFTVLAYVSVPASFSWPYFTVCTLVIVGLILFGFYGWDCAQVLQVRKIYLWMTVTFSVIFLIFVSIWSVYRVRVFGAPTYDFGLFAQMFHYLRTTGLPLTTLERDGLLSHFHIHMSPIYYLMVPFYLMSPKPETLQVLQAAVITSSVIPLWKLGTVHRLPDWQKMLLCGLLLLLPAFSGGVAYDLHENCFLTPLLLWLLYGIDRRSIPVTAVAALLTLMVKEDAAVYVAVIALFLMVRTILEKKSFQSREFLTGIALLAGSLLWFWMVTRYLWEIGTGVMTSRYHNFLYGDSDSLVTVIKAVLLNPMKAVYECVDPEKLRYIGLTLVPLVGMPLLTRRYERYLLLIPYLLVNLMSDYPYQHDVFYQYSFGSTACLIYLTMVNLADLKLPWKRIAVLCAALFLSSQCFISVILPHARIYAVQYHADPERYAQIEEVLNQIPQDAAVSATGYYTTPLSQRNVLYDVEYASREHILNSEYVVLNANLSYKTYSPDGFDSLEELLSALKNNGFTVCDELENILTIYSRTDKN